MSISPRTSTSTHSIPPALRSKAKHPGLHQFHCWHSAISEIYRSYKIQQSHQEHVEFPIIPRSERGNVSLYLEVQNGTRDMIMKAYWVDYLGHEIDKGFVNPGQTWCQQTWIGHPWVFRFEYQPSSHIHVTSISVTCNAAVHYVPFRIIQSTTAHNTKSTNGVGIHKFSIVQSDSVSGKTNLEIEDPIFPFPSSRIQSIEEAFLWSLQQMERENSNPKVLIRYLKNVCLYPDKPKYRQIRTANKIFWNEVWITAGRGMLHALGFEENGAYLETGPKEGFCLPSDRIRHFSTAVDELERWIEMEPKSTDQLKQPSGADGFGRAGFGRAGSTNGGERF